MPTAPDARASRRRFLEGAALGAVGMGVAGRTPAVAAVPAGQGTPADEAIGRAEAPAWSFALYVFQDPYEGEIQQPTTPPAGTRYVAAEVAIDNASNQPLSFSPAEIRLRDATGTEFRGGSAVGTEPFLSVRNLNGGERSRGWVWFILPEGSQIVGVAYYGPPPVFAIALDADGGE